MGCWRLGSQYVENQIRKVMRKPRQNIPTTHHRHRVYRICVQGGGLEKGQKPVQQYNERLEFQWNIANFMEVGAFLNCDIEWSFGVYPAIPGPGTGRQR